jgi:hypothetical protein
MTRKQPRGQWARAEDYEDLPREETSKQPLC